MTLGSAALALAIPASASATSAPTVVALTLNKSVVHTGGILQAVANVSITDGTPPAGTLTVSIDDGTSSTQESSVHVSGAGQYATNITDFPLGLFSVTADFKPDSAIQQGAAHDTKSATGHASATLALSVPKLTAGQTNKVTATVTSAVDVSSFGGDVRLDLGTASGVASCTPASTSARVASCTLSVPPQPAGAVASNAVFTSPNFDDANSTSTFTFVAAAPGKSGSSGSGSGSGGASTSASASAVPLATETAAPQASGSATSVAVKPTSSDTGVPVALIVGIVILVLLIAAAVVFLVMRARRKAAAD